MYNFIAPLLLVILSLTATHAQQAHGQPDPIITYTQSRLVNTRLRTEGSNFPLIRKAITVTFSKDLFGHPDIPRKPINGVDYDELCIKLLVSMQNEPLLAESLLILENHKLILVPLGNLKSVDQQIDWLLEKIRTLFKVQLVKEQPNTSPSLARPTRAKFFLHSHNFTNIP